MRWRVVCALREVMLIFWPTSALSSVDLPTFGRPTIATRPQRCCAPGTPSCSRAPLSSGTGGSDTGASFACRHRELARLDAIEQLLRRGLLGLAPRLALAGGVPLQRGHLALDLEGLRVRLAVRRGD